jgi:hypothetical protein
LTKIVQVDETEQEIEAGLQLLEIQKMLEDAKR